MAIYTAIEGNQSIIEEATDPGPTADDPIDVPEDLPPDDGPGDDDDINFDPTVPVETPNDSPVLGTHPPGWNFPPLLAMFWAEKSNDTTALQTLRTQLNKTNIAVAFDLTKEALFQDPTAVVPLAVETGDPWFPNASQQDLITSDDDYAPFTDSDGVFHPNGFIDTDSDGHYDRFLMSSRNVEITNLAIYNDTDNPNADTEDSSDTSYPLNSPVGSDVLFLDAEQTLALNVNSLIVDPLESQSYDNGIDNVPADEFGEFEAYNAFEINADDEKITDGSNGEITVTMQYTRGTWPTSTKVADLGRITNVKTGVDANDYFYVGVGFRSQLQSADSGHDEPVVQLFLSSSLDEGTYTPIALENILVKADAGKNIDHMVGVWLPVATYDGERIRFKVETSFPFQTQLDFHVTQYSGTYKLESNLNGLDTGTDKRVSRVGLYVHNPKKFSTPITKLELNRTIKGAGLNLRYSYGIPIADFSNYAYPRWGDVLTDTTEIAEYMVEGTATLLLLEGTLVSAADVTITVGQDYVIVDSDTVADFTNVGAAANTLGTTFEATGTTPTRWGNAQLLHITTDLIGYASSDENKPLCLWLVNKKDEDPTFDAPEIQAISGISLEANDNVLSLTVNEEHKTYIAAVIDADGYVGVLISP